MTNTKERREYRAVYAAHKLARETDLSEGEAKELVNHATRTSDSGLAQRARTQTRAELDDLGYSWRQLAAEADDDLAEKKQAKTNQFGNPVN